MHVSPKVRSTETRPAHVVATALLVAAGYYAGANLGILLRFPPSVPSAVWPPNSILTATLLLAPRRRWWIYLLAALPAHLAAELPAWPATLVFALFATNCSEALLAALFVRRFNEAPECLDTLRRVAVFIAGAVLLAPFLSSFPDAAAVNALLGQPFWAVWRTRFASNILTELTVAPAILMAVCARRSAAPFSTVRRRVEAALLAALLVTAAVLVFATGEGNVAAIAGTTSLPAVWLFPFLLWAAVRFGPLGSSLSLLVTTLVAIWGATHARGPFTALPDYVPSLQIFLSVIAVPLMCLAALIEERRRVGDALAERLRFEELLARLSSSFVHLPSHQLEGAVAASLRGLGEFLQLDRVLLLRLEAGSRTLAVANSWAAPGFDRDPPAIVARDCGAAVARLLENEPFVFLRSRDSALLPDSDVASSAVIPLLGMDRPRGGLALESIGGERTWSQEVLQRLRLVGEVFANVLRRQEAEDALRASEAMKSAILSSLASGVAVLDSAGRIIAVNESWASLRTDSVPAPFGGAPVGSDYLQLCSGAAAAGVAHAEDMLAGTAEVLGGARSGFSLEVSSAPTDQMERWFGIAVVPLNRREGGAVVSNTDVTKRKRAEMEVQKNRQELAHFARVATVGELTASLAHELRQPLTGIMTNAQAARRFLSAVPPDLPEVRACLEDIIADDQRAAHSIQRLREFLRKGDVQHSRLDLNDVVGDVTRLLGSDAVIRKTRVRVERSPGPVVVSGDRVHLEQVILNLLMNAMEAMAEVPQEERKVVIRTETAEARAHVAVEDSGTGFRADSAERLFEPFYTTKATGMGMGLSVARSIVEAHGGTIWATNNSTRGATFHFALPQADEPA